MSPRWPWFFAGMVAALATCGALGMTVIQTGAFEARASKPDDPISAWVTHTTMSNAMRREARSVPAPASFTREQILAGLRLYQSRCIACHGGPGVARADWVQGLTPSPPYLIDASQRWTRPELYWMVKHGVKMTAMPAWGPTENDQEVWDVVAFLVAMPDIKPAEFQRIEAGRTQVQAAAPKRQAR